MISIISFAILLGLFNSLDLCLTPKRKGAFTRQFISIITISIPAVYQAVLSTTSFDNNEFAKLWFNYFYLTYLLTILLTFSIILLFVYSPLNSKLKSSDRYHIFTFFDFLFNGYYSFKKEFDAQFILQNQAKIGVNPNEIHNELRDSIPRFIREIYSTVDNDDFEGYVGYVLFGFVQQFLSETDARFTLRQLNTVTNKMEAVFTTRSESLPGPIPLNKKNLINKSMKEGIPLLYSRNESEHFHTKNKSLKKGIYDDYVSYCILKTHDNKPFYSICLDVKGDRAVNRIHTLVDSNIFTLICNAIAERILNDINWSEYGNQKN